MRLSSYRVSSRARRRSGLAALRTLLGKGRLVRLGYALWPCSPSRLTPDGLAGVARQALDEPGVEWEPTEAERAYDEGLSTQIPVKLGRPPKAASRVKVLIIMHVGTYITSSRETAQEA